MSKTNHTKQCPCALRAHDLTLWAVRPIARRLMLHHRVCIEHGKRILKELREVNESVEIMAQEMARWNQRRE